jgi:TolB protein
MTVKTTTIRSTRATAGLMFAAALFAAPATELAAQQDTTRIPPGVELETRYSVSGRRAVAVRPFAGPIPLAGAVGQIGAIVTQDLSLSDRYEMYPVPADLQTPGPIDYQAWNSLNLEFLVTGDVTPTADGFLVDIVVHDVVFGREHRRGTYALPATGSPDFRMAVHAVSDEMVQWISNQPGMAATRIAFTRFNQDELTYDLLIVDSDGQNLRRILGGPPQVHSPAWSPDGRRVAYTIAETDGWKLIERNLVTGRNTTVATGSELFLTPSYSPDGTRLFYAVWLPGGNEIMEADVGGDDSPRRLTETGGDNMTPTLSPDGRRMAWLSTRTGQNHIYIGNADGSSARQLTPPGRNVEFHGPDWSPQGNRITFHGSARGPYQIMIADADRPTQQVRQLTSTGWNEDPSWAPDGRHIVYSGAGAQGEGLYVIDTVTGTIRLLTRGAKLRTADWSSSMAGAVLSRR